MFLIILSSYHLYTLVGTDNNEIFCIFLSYQFEEILFYQFQPFPCGKSWNWLSQAVHTCIVVACVVAIDISNLK